MSSLTPTPTVSSIPSEGEGLSTGTILIIVGAVFSVLVVLLGAIYLTLVCRSRTQKVPITINKTLMKSSDINLDEVVEEDSNATIIEEKNGNLFHSVSALRVFSFISPWIFGTESPFRYAEAKETW